MKASNEKTYTPFRFKNFEVAHQNSAMKIGVDSVTLGAWAQIADAENILDIGTGCGILSLMCAQRTPFAQIDAVELDIDSYIESSNNAKQSPWSDRISIFHSSLQQFAVEADMTYDHIISNPPYYEYHNCDHDAQRQSARQTVDLTHDELLHNCQLLLNPGGKFSLILPALQGTALIRKAHKFGFYPSRITRILPTPTKKCNRLLIELSRKVNRFTVNQLTIRQKSGEYHTDYRSLTQDFYLQF